MGATVGPWQLAFWRPRPKGYLGRSELTILLILAVIPFLSITVRLLSLPGVLDASLFATSFLADIGTVLNRYLSLSAVQSVERWTITYLLLLPGCALIIAIARLTFGLRVLGFRSILIAVGFQQAGFVPSLILIVIIVGIAIFLRPIFRSIQLTYYARVAVILGLCSITMVAALIIGYILRSEAIWGIAFFPVIVLGLLAEGVSQSVERDDPATACIRISSTVGVACMLALISQMPAVRALMLEFPELMLPQMVAIVLISEFYDFRLLQDWKPNARDLPRPLSLGEPEGLRVALVRNRSETGVIGHLGPQSAKISRRNSVQRIVDALRDGGHQVKVMEGDMSLLPELRRFLAPDHMGRVDRGIVLNVAEGIQGDGRAAHVAAMCEMAGVAYTGSPPSSLVLCSDHLSLDGLMQREGIPTPERFLLPAATDIDPYQLKYPLKLRPRFDPDRIVRDVDRPNKWQSAIQQMVQTESGEIIVESPVSGRRLIVPLLGNNEPVCLPIIELRKQEKLCPVDLSQQTQDLLRSAATSVFRLVGCRDYARVEFALDDADGSKPYFIELRAMGIFSRNGAFAVAAQYDGMNYAQLLNNVVAVAWSRIAKGHGFEHTQLVGNDFAEMLAPGFRPLVS